jgi:hypothetical protein
MKTSITCSVRGLQEILGEPPRLSLRRGRNLGDIIIDAKPRQEDGVSGPCSGCKLCENMRPTTSFAGRNGKQYQVRGDHTCESVGMIYGMHCDVCGHVVYVGKSQNSLRERFYGHRRDFALKDREKPVAHFMDEGHEWRHMKLVGVEQVRGRDVLWVVREKFWIGKLGTLQEENRQW